MGPDAGDDHVHCTRTARLMLHYIIAALAVYVVFLVMFPAHVAAGTLLLITSGLTLVKKIDWTVVPW